MASGSTPHWKLPTAAKAGSKILTAISVAQTLAETMTTGTGVLIATQTEIAIAIVTGTETGTVIAIVTRTVTAMATADPDRVDLILRLAATSRFRAIRSAPFARTWAAAGLRRPSVTMAAAWETSSTINGRLECTRQ